MGPEKRTYKGEAMGENMAMHWTSKGEDFNGEDCCEQWYSEKDKYNFDKHDGDMAENADIQVGDSVLFNDNEKFIKSKFDKISYVWDDKMRSMLGNTYTVQPKLKDLNDQK